MSDRSESTETVPELGINALLAAWRAWIKRHNQTDSKLEMWDDGSGLFIERDLYGPEHSFNDVQELMKILRR